ncbi:MAG: GDP-mannose 4,6-dehydratase [Ignavibacteriales bacterium]
MKKALITGINGQDGKYLREFLKEKKYRVFGISNSISEVELDSLANQKITVLKGDICDLSFMEKVMLETCPDEVYNLAAQSSVSKSYENYIETMKINSMAVIQMLDIMKRNKINCKFFQASSSEIFGIPNNPMVNEEAEYRPCNPYGISKLASHLYMKNFRKWNNGHTVNGILFSHESPIRPENFVSRKITKGISDIIRGEKANISLGNIDIVKDWGFAGEYIEAMWMMLQQDEPDDFIISSGESHSIREFLEIAFSHVGLEWGKYVVIDPALYRPIEYKELIGDNSKAREKLNWTPKTKFKDLVKMMVDYDMKGSNIK